MAPIVIPGTICVTYSEITAGCFRKLLSTLMEEKSEYHRLTSSSTFYDIGHGLGFCVYQAALQVGCTSLGIEYAQNKFDLSL